MFKTLTALAVLCAAAPASAQFANRHVGLELSPLRFTDSELTTGVGITVDASAYIDDGFELGGRVPFNLFLTTQAARQRLATGGQLYAKYLFTQEALRPWVDLELDMLYIFRDNADASTQQQVFCGPGVSFGLDYFVTESVSVGARTMFTLYVAVNNNAPLRPAYGGTANVSFSF
jgi:outer membrane protein